MAGTEPAAASGSERPSGQHLTDERPAAPDQTVEELRAELERERRRTVALLRHLDDAVTLATADGVILEGSGDVKGLLGYPPGYLRNHVLLDLVHPADKDRAVALRARMLTSEGVEIRDVFRVRAADGSWADLEVVLVNLLSDPDVGSVLATTRNITAQRREGQRLAAAHDLALRQAEERTRVMAAVSHELRTPLHTVLGVTEALLSTGLDDRQRAMVEAAHAEGRNLRRLVDDLLDLARVEAGEMVLRQSVVDPVAVVARACDAASAEPAGGGDDASDGIVIRYLDGLPTHVAADPERFAQVVTTLVEVARARAVDHRIEVALEPRTTLSPGLRLRVRAPGPPMREDEARGMFEPLHPDEDGPGADGAVPTWRVGGMGLRMAIARRLALLMGGDVTVADVHGGVLFTFTCSAPPAEAPVGVAPTSGPVSGGRVLVVDDSPTNRLLAGNQLEHLGYTAAEAETGEAALELLAHEAFDAVLMDWQLPGIDGLETTRRFRQMAPPDAPRVPVIAITASVRPGDEARCVAAGMDALMAKPVLLDDLAAALARWIGDPAAAPGAPPGPQAVPPTRSPAGRPAPEAPSGGRPAEVPLVDRAVVDAAVDDFGDAGIVVQLVEVFGEELPGRRRELVAALVAADPERVDRAAHVLRGPSQMLGATRLAEWCAAVGDRLAGGADAGELAAEAAALCDDTAAALAACADGLDAPPR